MVAVAIAPAQTGSDESGPIRTLVVIPLAGLHLRMVGDQYIDTYEKQGGRIVACKLVAQHNDDIAYLLGGLDGRGLAIVFEADHLLENKPKGPFLRTDVPRDYISPTSEIADQFIRLIFSPEELLTSGDLR